MKKLTVALAVCAFLAMGAGVAKADHYHRSNYPNPYRYDRCDRDYRDYRSSYRHDNCHRDAYYVAPRCATPVYAAPVYAAPVYGYPNVGVGFSTKNFSFYYGR